MALDYDPLESKENAAVRLARIHLVSECSERMPRKQIAKARRPSAIHGGAQIGSELMSGAFSRFERDIASEALCDNNIDGTFADIISLDKAVVVEVWELSFAQDAAGFAHLLQSFYFFDSNVEKPDSRKFNMEWQGGHGTAHGREINEMRLVCTDRSAHIEHYRFTLERRPQCGNRRALDAFYHLEIETGHRHQRAGISGRDCDIGFAFFHRVDGQPH